MTHYDHDTLSRFGLDPALVDDPEAVAAHLDACDACRGYFEVVNEIDAALRDTDMWEQVDHLLIPSELRSQTFKLKDAIEAEEADAGRRLEPLLKSPLRFRAGKITTNPKLLTAGAVRLLCAEANKRHEKRPLFSYEIADAAFEIARALPKGPESRRRFSIAISLRERANAQRFLGNFKDALEALGYAEKFFDETPAADPHDIAIVQFIRATIFMKSERLDEAIAESAKCLPIFRDYSDRSHELSALMIQAACFYLSGANMEAVGLYEKVITRAREAEDVKILARGLTNAANSYTELSDLDTAERYYVEAVVLFDELGIVTEKARSSWALASVVVKRGDLVTGGERLDAARRELQRLGLQNDHALATLEWAEALLARGKAEGVATACREIVMRFESEGMMKNARLALAYVHEALARGTATPTLVRHVRLYLEALPSRPNDAFVPLQ
jgi:tetratricopeptide (TPR) repeat protein